MPAIADIKTRLAEIQAAIPGILRTHAQAPAALNDLPAFVNFTGAAQMRAQGANYRQENRVFLMRLYAVHVQSGIDGEAERALEPFFESVPAAFLSHPSLGMNGNLLPGILQTDFMGDNGVQVFEFAGERYLGVEFRLSVTRILGVVYAEHE